MNTLVIDTGTSVKMSIEEAEDTPLSTLSTSERFLGMQIQFVPLSFGKCQ